MVSPHRAFRLKFKCHFVSNNLSKSHTLCNVCVQGMRRTEARRVLVCAKVLVSLQMTVKPQKQKGSRCLFVIRSWYFPQYESGPVPLLQTSPSPTNTQTDTRTHKRVDNLHLCTFRVKTKLAVYRTSQACLFCPSFRRASRNSCCWCLVL